MLIHLVCAARPNFMKIAPLYHALKNEAWAKPTIVHTGQHYDTNMSSSFFKDLNLPSPDIHLGVGSGTHAEHTGKVMIAYEKVLMQTTPDLVIVVGDVNSTLAATLAATKLGTQVAHLEAGLRSFDRRMPEEINRVATDALADSLWTPSRDANQNLQTEGVPRERIQLVGNIMIDSFEMMKPKIKQQNTHLAMNLERLAYGVVTLHRPSNVDNIGILEKIYNNLAKISATMPLVFPIHPRTKKKFQEAGLSSKISASPNIFTPEPMNYIRFMSLVLNARFVLTDSGGIQEETSYLGIPCLTLRENTERPVTISHGTNQLVNVDQLMAQFEAIVHNSNKQPAQIELWDGRTAQRLVQIIEAINT